MGGIELRDGTLVVDREPNDLDDLAIRFSAILDDVGINHAFISGYVAILAGRARATEDIDVLLEHTVDDEYDHASLEHHITARLTTVDATLPIGPLELQIAYKLYLGTPKDFEDAVHLYAMFRESLSTQELERWVAKLDVEDEYDRLEHA